MKKGDPGYWAWRKKVGRPKSIANPKKLWNFACDYFESVDLSPYKKQELLRGGDRAGEVVEIDTIMPYTWAGLEAYLYERGIVSDLDKYKHNFDNAYTEFADIVRAINKVMFDQKFSGAAVGAFNANIIARELGLAERSEVDQVNVNTGTEEGIDKRIEALLDKLGKKKI